MMIPLVLALVLTSGLLAGFFFAWWCSCMVGLRTVRDSTFVETMQSINGSLPNARFAVPFFAPVLLAPIVAFMLLAGGNRESGGWTVATAVLSLLTFGITAGRNVPLNNELAKAALNNATAARSRFEMPWIRWNSLRTLSSLLAFAASLFVLLRLR